MVNTMATGWLKCKPVVTLKPLVQAKTNKQQYYNKSHNTEIILVQGSLACNVKVLLECKQILIGTEEWVKRSQIYKYHHVCCWINDRGKEEECCHSNKKKEDRSLNWCVGTETSINNLQMYSHKILVLILG